MSYYSVLSCCFAKASCIALWKMVKKPMLSPELLLNISAKLSI